MRTRPAGRNTLLQCTPNRPERTQRGRQEVCICLVPLPAHSSTCPAHDSHRTRVRWRPPNKKLGSVGPWHIGENIAGRLLAAGYPVAGQDKSRQNAVDKVAGHAVLGRERGTPPWAGWVLIVSGRVSFEIRAKDSVLWHRDHRRRLRPVQPGRHRSRPSRVAVAGFVRDGSFNLYSHPERLDLRR